MEVVPPIRFVDHQNALNARIIKTTDFIFIGMA